MRRPSVSAAATVLAVAGAALFVFSQLEPGLLLRDTTPSGGDMGAHVWGPAYLRDRLLPAGRMTGWAPDWYAGFPFLTFYFPLPNLLVVLADVVLPYGVAFKLVSVLGLVSLPVAAWAFGRLAGLRAPGPACLAVAMVPFLFERSFTIYGGNIASTLAGEFAFSIALSLALVFLGVLARGLESGRHKALAASLLALTVLSHLLPALFAVVGAVVLTLLRPGGRRLVHSAAVGAVAALLTAFWALPFVVRLPFSNDMGWEKILTYRKSLLSEPGTVLVVLAAAGVVVSLAFRLRTGAFLSAMAALSAAAFVWAPQGRLWNARLLPFWFLCLYLLAGVAVSEVGRGVGRVLDRAGEGAERTGAVLAPVVALAAAVVHVGMPLQLFPEWTGLRGKDRSFVPDWVRWNYSGYEDKPSYGEYQDLVASMEAVGRDRGCGRAFWEYEPELDRLGTPMALMLLPYWTDGCIGSMEGLYFESSATTPYHFLLQAELSSAPSRPQRELPYRGLDLARGVEHLRLLGVRYYMA
ncbi:MAG: 6-pyruvoyl-tetrahydropterin synthase-related protein, partial [Actinomycetota bacterium]|nr:6-pyruvoyl-tetrahydropterin synthase-related protein [Actinomycetota bacterium]